MHLRLFFAIILFLYSSAPLSAMAPGGLTNPPILDATVERDGPVVHISGTIDDENVATVKLFVKINGVPMEMTIPVENGVFDSTINVHPDVNTLILTAIDEDDLEDSSTHDI